MAAGEAEVEEAEVGLFRTQEGKEEGRKGVRRKEYLQAAHQAGKAAGEGAEAEGAEGEVGLLFFFLN